MNIIDLLFPKFCIYCGLPSKYICNNCESKIDKVSFQECIYCNNLSINGETHKLCKQNNPLYIDSHNFSFIYNEFSKEIFLQAKANYNAYSIFNEIFRFKEFINLSLNFNIDFITYIPMSKSINNTRLMDHSKIIATEISNKLNEPLLEIFTRSRFFKSQKYKTKDKRLRSSGLLIKPNINVNNKSILIVDDISTSGGTLINAASILKKLDAKNVHCYTLFKRLKN